MTLADARARVPDLEVRDHDPQADRGWLDRIAGGCVRYTPMAAADPPDGVTLDITGCAHLFGGEAALTTDARARLEPFGLTVRTAIASGAEAARALARHGGVAKDEAGKGGEAAAVRRLPVAALGLDSEIETGLRRAGLKTIGDLAGRPRSPLAARFGMVMVTRLENLLGESRAPLDPLLVEPAISCVKRFAEPLGRTEHALKALAELTAEMIDALERRAAGGRRFAAFFFRADGRVLRLAIETGAPLRDAKAVMRLFGERIDSLDDPIDPGFGFDAIRLTVPVAEPFAAAQLALEGGEENADEVEAMIDRLSTRLGRGGIRRFARVDTHIPEQMQIAFPAIERSDLRAWPRSGASDPPMRPLYLFDPPEPIAVIAEVPDGPPRRFRWRRNLREVTRYEGPERIAAEWWRAKNDPLGEKRLTRDYYRIEDAMGRRYWVFRHGLIEREKANPEWFLHGLFA